MPNGSDLIPSGQRPSLHDEVRSLLMSQIAEGRPAPGERLPSEPLLAEQYGISRSTLREILSGLEAEGLIRRAHGVGTFVTEERPRLRTSLDLDIGVTEAVLAANATLGVEVLSAQQKPVAPWMHEALGLDRDQRVFLVERIIRVDDVPAAHALDIIPWRVIETAGSPDYDGSSIYRYLERDCHIQLSGGVAEISATLATSRMASALDRRRDSPLLRLEQTEESAAGVPVLLSREHYVPGVFNLTVRRLRQGTSEFLTSRGWTDTPSPAGVSPPEVAAEATDVTY